MWLMASLIAVGVMIWIAIFMIDHYLFAEDRSAPAGAAVISVPPAVSLGALLQAWRGGWTGQA
ncbi:hypothetical protein [uncultured Bradyrhizobium sp.]|uniref:hypothetical protein n=1 Tax=uncultured Bradyrhizobium sp. TaxID=199684 RepID=UPI0035CA58DB